MDEHGISYEPEEKYEFKLTLRGKINFWFYWNVKRRWGKLGKNLIWMLPKRVVYWCVIRAAVEVGPNYNPSSVTAEEMLKKFNYS